MDDEYQPTDEWDKVEPPLDSQAGALSRFLAQAEVEKKKLKADPYDSDWDEEADDGHIVPTGMRTDDRRTDEERKTRRKKQDTDVYDEDWS